MAENPLVQLAKAGQSIWYDQMVRSLVTKGTLRELILRDDLRGLTSNPTIFEKAIGGSSEYDAQLSALARAGKSRDEIYEELVVDDITRAADVFREVYDRTDAHDGYVSLEVSPTLAHDTAATIADGRRLFARVGRPNLMIKVPATPEGIPAVRTLISEGINVNVTLIFSRAVYAEVIEAYLAGLEDRVRAGKPVDAVASVASFFVSRIDSAADKQLEAKIAGASAAEKAKLSSLLGKTAIANARLAYELWKERFSGKRFAGLQKKGARPQRALWASTGTKNPAYSDILYLDELIGPDTVNTVPPATYDAFRDHGRVRPSLEEDLAGAKATLEALESAGVSLDAITHQLIVDGVKSFEDSFLSLMETIEARRDAVLRAQAGRETFRIGKYEEAATEALARIDAGKLVARIWKKDAAVWKKDAAHAKIIASSLGWLRVVETMKGHVSELDAFADEIRPEFEHVVVLGMGGSSLCSEVLRTAFGHRKGYPRLHVLDSTVPGSVKSLERRIDKKKTLFIVASKSGTTTEPVMFHQYFYGRLKAVRGEDAGAAFIAVTDPGTQLARDAARDGFRRTFVNPADIGGRYSALSLFGLVPAALAGVDVAAFLERAEHAMHVCSPHLVARENRGAMLGATLATLAAQGRDKVTIVASPTFSALGLWIEQLVAESTGKEGKGILPIAGEPLAAPSKYGADRVFVVIRDAEWSDARIDALAAAGHPVIEHVLEPIDLGDEFFVWEFATAVAGALLEINPFDQPNVQESKNNTKRLLDEFRTKGHLPTAEPRGGEGNLKVFVPRELAALRPESRTVTSVLADLLASTRPGDYVALQLFIAETADRNTIVDEIRAAIRDATRLATTAGYGPRFLHSTGQYHKGAGNNGIFIQLVGSDEDIVEIPGEPFTFAELKDAQALGDFQVLETRGKRAVRIHIGRSITNGLRQFQEIVADVLAARQVS